jgi:hypothetical protein
MLEASHLSRGEHHQPSPLYRQVQALHPQGCPEVTDTPQLQACHRSNALAASGEFLSEFAVLVFRKVDDRLLLVAFLIGADLLRVGAL